MNTWKLSERITVGGQPGTRELVEFARGGMRSIVNLRTDGEDNQPMSPAEEGTEAAGAGMAYAHIPISPGEPDDAAAEAFQEKLLTLPKPIYVHCQGGTRAAAFTAMHLALEHGWTGDEALAHAAKCGKPIESEPLAAFVKTRIDREIGAAG